MEEQYRIEYDSLGSMQVPKDALYGIQTLRATQNFSITTMKTHPLMIKSLGMVKKASALANYETGHLDRDRLKFILLACDEVIAGKWNHYFITDVIQGGAGTSTNMNANEVIANRAAQLANRKLGTYDYIHPNDHINFGQSTNDVFPTAGKLTSLLLVEQLLEMVTVLQEALQEKAIAFDDVIKPGRTHLQDAVPIRMGQEFHAYATSFLRDVQRIKKSFEPLHASNMGATAVGTGLNADEGYRRICIQRLSEISGFHFTSTRDLIDGTRNVDPFVWASSSLKTLAVNLSKMCNDLRLMASGPITGFSEIVLPAKQPGSSIMPGKVNPVIPEVVNQVCFQVFGNDVTILKAAEAGQLELNVFEPVLFFNLFQSMEVLINGIDTLVRNCIVNLQANKERCKFMVDNSLVSATGLAAHIGYANASKYAKQALKENRKLRELIVENGLMDEKRLDEVLNVKEMTRPGIPGMRKKKVTKKTKHA